MNLEGSIAAFFPNHEADLIFSNTIDTGRGRLKQNGFQRRLNTHTQKYRRDSRIFPKNAFYGLINRLRGNYHVDTRLTATIRDISR